jgi:hypothetical protein
MRRALLNQAGIDTVHLTNFDMVDAAICALTAHNLASNKPCKSYGEPVNRPEKLYFVHGNREKRQKCGL